MTNLKTLKVGDFVMIPYSVCPKGKIIKFVDGYYHVKIKNNKNKYEVRQYLPETLINMNTDISKFIK